MKYILEDFIMRSNLADIVTGIIIGLISFVIGINSEKMDQHIDQIKSKTHCVSESSI
jgi:hypothetical protein